MTHRPASDEKFLEYVLRSTRNRIRFVDVASAGLVLLAAAVVMLLGIAVADHAAPGGLSRETRSLLRWAGLAVLLAGLVVTILRPLARRLNDLYIARSIERASPGFRNELTAALQFGTGEVDPAVLAALKRRAGKRARETDVARVVSMKGLALAGGALGAALIVLLVYAALSPKPLLPSVQRALGNEALAAPTRTRFLDAAPADGSRVISGRTVHFTARIEQPAGEAVVRISRDGGETVLSDDVLTMTPRKDDGETLWHAAWTAGATDGLASFRMVCGDAATPPRRLLVLPPPVLKNVTTTIEWPAYTRRLPSTSAGGEIRALSGSVATVTADAPLPVASAEIEFLQAGESRPLQPAGRKLIARFSVERADQYVIHYQLADGLGEARSVAWPIQLLPDTPPGVRLRRPTGELTLPVNARLELLVDASDDVGLIDIELHCRRGEEEFTIPLFDQRPPGQRTQTLRRDLPVRRFGDVGESIEASVHARDAKPTGATSRGQLGRSEPFTLHIGPADRQLAEQQRARQEALDRAEAETQDAATDQASANDAEEGEAADSTTTSTQQPADETQTPAQPADADAGSEPSLEELLDVTPQDAARLEEIERRMQPSPESAAPANNSTGEAQNGESPSNAQPQQSAGPSTTSEGTAENGEPAEGNGVDAQDGQDDADGQASSDAAGAEGEEADGAGAGASDMHDSQAGGSEEADEQRGEVDAVDAETLRGRREAQRLGSIGRALDEAARQVRDDEVDEQLLDDLGMTPQEFRDFVEASRRQYEQAKRRGGDARQIVEGEGQAVGEPGVQEGRGTNLEGTSREQRGSEGGRDVRESRGRQVAPEYRKYLEGFVTDVNADPAESSAP